MSWIAIGIIVAIVVLVGVFIGAGYVKSPPDKAYIISGPHKKTRMLIGKAGIKIPLIERMDKLDLSLIPIDVKTSSEVPTADYINIKVDAAVNVKIGKDTESLNKAAVNFLNKRNEEIGRVAREVLEGNMREIVGQMRLEEMVSDRQKFAEMVKENAAPDLAAMGLEIISFNVQNFVDGNQVIENLGVDNVEQIRKKAQIARAQSERDVAIEKAKAAKEANDAKATAQEAIAERDAQLATKQAALKKEVDKEKAQADAALGIEEENQRKLRDVAATDADIAKAEREAELKQKEIQLKEYELDAIIRKQADAEKYAAEQKAEAQRIARQSQAEADKFEAQRRAEADKFTAEQRAAAMRIEAEQKAEALKIEAEAKKQAALAEAEGITAIGTAEAEAIQKKAEAQKLMGEASVIEMYLNALPQIVANAAAPLTNVDSITMYGEGNSAKLVGDVMKSANQVMAGLADNGIDIQAMLAGAMAGKLASN